MAAIGAASAPLTNCDRHAGKGDAVMSAGKAISPNSERLVDQLANRIGGLGVELADVAGNLQEVAGRVTSQAGRFGHLQQTAKTMVSANHNIATASQAVQTATSA